MPCPQVHRPDENCRVEVAGYLSEWVAGLNRNSQSPERQVNRAAPAAATHAPRSLATVRAGAIVRLRSHRNDNAVGLDRHTLDNKACRNKVCDPLSHRADSPVEVSARTRSARIRIESEPKVGPPDCGLDRLPALARSGGEGMLVVETVGRIRREHLVKRKSIKEIARELNLSRNTVRRVLRSGETAFSYEREFSRARSDLSRSQAGGPSVRLVEHAASTQSFIPPRQNARPVKPGP